MIRIRFFIEWQSKKGGHSTLCLKAHHIFKSNIRNPNNSATKTPYIFNYPRFDFLIEFIFKIQLQTTTKIVLHHNHSVKQWVTMKCRYTHKIDEHWKIYNVHIKKHFLRTLTHLTWVTENICDHVEQEQYFSLKFCIKTF